MKGILIIGHGDLPKGMVNSTKMFFGEDVAAIDCLCLYADTALDQYAIALKDKIAALDDGDGVIILADLFGGSPCNQAILQMNDRVEILSGVNFGMLLELLATREAEISLHDIIHTGTAGILNVREQLQQLDEDDE